jgi:MFS family permease
VYSHPSAVLSFRPIAANDAGQKFFNSQSGAQKVSFAAVTEPKDLSRESESSLRGFWSLFVTQFQGAFSDNVLKNLVVFLLVGMDMSLARKHEFGEVVTALFALPFILFSMAGGFLADRRSKRTMTIGVKVFEVFVMLLALAGFVWMQRQLNLGIAASWRTCWPLVACVFLMGMHSAFFGPSKYGLLPELLPEKNCPGATVCWNSARSWPSFSAFPPLPGCPYISGLSAGCLP